MNGKMRAIKRMLFVLSACLWITACKGNEKDAADPIDMKTENATLDVTIPTPDKMMPILCKDGNKLAEIDGRANCTAVDDGVFYSIFVPGDTDYTATAEYRLYRMKDNTDILLGSLKDQGYEAAFCRTEFGGRIYTLAVTGNIMDHDPDDLLLLIFDPKEGTMKKEVISRDGFPYASLAVVNGKLLVMNHEMSKTKADKIYEYDPTSEEAREVITVLPDEGSLRSVSSERKKDTGTKDSVYLLRWKGREGAEAEFFLDRYDNEYKKQEEILLNDKLVNAIERISGMGSRLDAMNELGYNVAHFSIMEDRYLLYENFTVARILIDMETNETLLAKDDLFNVSNGGRTLIFRADYDPEMTTDPEIYEFSGGTLQRVSFQPPADHKLVQSVSCSQNGTGLAVMADVGSAALQTRVIKMFSMP